MSKFDILYVKKKALVPESVESHANSPPPYSKQVGCTRGILLIVWEAGKLALLNRAVVCFSVYKYICKVRLRIMLKSYFQIPKHVQ